MILTCPQCQAQYKLDPAQLGAAGRDVRCVTCSHMWFQIPDTAVPEMKASEPQKPTEAASQLQEAGAQSITDALNSILENDDAAFEAVLSTVAQNAKDKGAKGEASPKSAPDTVMPRTPAPEGKKSVIRQDAALAILTHDPLGMGASVFGGMVFLLCSFLTLAVIFLGKSPIVHHWPQTALLYKTLGFEVKAPGEGLRLSEITAERRIDDHGKMLVVEGKMTNMSEHDIAYPALHVILKNDRNGITKTWDLKQGVTQIASGDIVPLMLQLDGVPEDGSTVEVRVKEK